MDSYMSDVPELALVKIYLYWHHLEEQQMLFTEMLYNNSNQFLRTKTW